MPSALALQAADEAEHSLRSRFVSVCVKREAMWVRRRLSPLVRLSPVNAQNVCRLGASCCGSATPHSAINAYSRGLRAELPYDSLLSMVAASPCLKHWRALCASDFRHRTAFIRAAFSREMSKGVSGTKTGLKLPTGSLAGASPSAIRRPVVAVDESGFVRSLEVVASCGLKVVVWDFDLTILSIHSFGERIAPAAVAVRSMEADFRDLAFFRRVVSELRSRSIDVAVASFGRYDVIQAYMDRIFEDASVDSSIGSRVFDRANILTPSTVGLPDGCSMPGGKNTLLQHICEKHGAMPRDVIFFDGGFCSRHPAGWLAGESRGLTLHCTPIIAMNRFSLQTT